MCCPSCRADPLLCQVGAYYHDIGKIVKPEYFVENMGENRGIHERLRPSMSKLIIISHVKEGIELAREDGLPDRIIDMIPMHHGTTVVEYFFHKARELSEGGSHESEAEYRYPGPKPRFKEAGILMLADTMEAVAKTIQEPSHARFQGMAHEIIQKRMLDGQLDECNLTMRDLNRIEESFARTLTNMYHARIRYPADEKGEEEGAPAHPHDKENGRAAMNRQQSSVGS
jgi:putative nucleotidyltransferase with HDIG domain